MTASRLFWALGYSVPEYHIVVVSRDQLRVGPGARIHANVVIGADCSVGEDVELLPNVVLYPNVRIGARVSNRPCAPW